MHDAHSSSQRDERVSRGPAEPDGGISDKSEFGPGGRGVDAGEELDDLPQQPGLDTPYGDRSASQEQAAVERERDQPPPPNSRPGDVGSAQGETPGKVAGTQF